VLNSWECPRCPFAEHPNPTASNGLCILLAGPYS
jgi:hypothetical protein